MQLGLENTEQMLQRLDSPQMEFESIQVAGSNGKGTTSAFLSHALHLTGLHTGTFTSPHLCRIEERIRIDGRPIDAHQLDDLLLTIRTASESAPACSLTFFEATFLAAMLAFRAHGVEWAVVEVGLGGRYDATRCCHPVACLITDISLEHTDILGSTLPQIAAEKAAIAGSGALLLAKWPTDEQTRAAMLAEVASPSLAWWFEPNTKQLTRFDTVRQEWPEIESGVLPDTEASPHSGKASESSGSSKSGKVSESWQSQQSGKASESDGASKSGKVSESWESQQSGKSLERSYESSAGMSMRDEATGLALALIEKLGLQLSAEQAETVARETHWPARMQTIQLHGLNVLLDAAHNPSGMQRLIAEVCELHAGNELVLLLGATSQVDLNAFIAPLQQLAEAMLLRHIVLTEPEGGRYPGIPVAELEDALKTLLPHTRCSSFCTPHDALEKALELAQNTDSHQSKCLLLSCGSLYLQGNLMTISGFDSDANLSIWTAQ
jgi:folylpolyglutamate synthase/dihydropteroate synthase